MERQSPPKTQELQVLCAPRIFRGRGFALRDMFERLIGKERGEMRRHVVLIQLLSDAMRSNAHRLPF